MVLWDFMVVLWDCMVFSCFFFVGFGNNMIGWGFDGVLCRDFHGGFNGKWPNGDISWDIQPQLDVTCGIFVGLYPAW